MLTVIADENIANIHQYLSHHQARIITMAGRQIDGNSIAAHQADAVFIRSVSPMNESTLGNASDLPVKFIGSATIGTDHVDQAFLKRHNIAFANAAGCSKHSVAQYVISSILATYPHYRHQAIKLGIIGLGNIGSTLAQYAQKFGWQVLGYDPFLPKSSINLHDFDALLANSDVISIHTPLTHNGAYPTFKLFNQQTLDLIDKNTLLINTARGEIIDENALLTAFIHRGGRAILDVFPDEPTISKTLLDGLTLATPHIAGYTLEGKLRGTDMIYQAFCRHFHLPIVQDLQTLLPANPFAFADFYQQSNGDSKQAVAQFYPIDQDDALLRAVSTDAGVSGSDFDRLRKEYRLRREWLF